MALKSLNGLQLFAEGGGDGGASVGGGESGAGTVSAGDKTETAYPENIPERAKKYYDMAVKKTQNVGTANDDTAISKKSITTEEEKASATEPKRLTYKELIKSDEYKAEHERHLQKVIKDRMKSHDEILGLVVRKYGVDVNSETFKEDLKNALTEDDSVYEKYAEEHDVSINEAKRMIGIEEQLKQANRVAEERKAQEEYENTIGALKRSGESTNAEYPEFDLDSAMKDERFRRLVVAFGGNTTQAYEAVNHRALKQRAVTEAEARAQATVQNSIRANRARPLEGGISSNNSVGDVPNFKNMNLEQLRRYALQHKIKR